MFSIILAARRITEYPLLDIFMKVNINNCGENIHPHECLDLLHLYKYTCLALGWCICTHMF